MTYRVHLERVVRQAGFVDIEAKDEHEARHCVKRWAAIKGSPLAPTWVEDMPKGAIVVGEAEAV